MTARILLIFFIILLSCSKEEAKYEPKPRSDPYKLYEEGFNAFSKGDYFFAEKKFSEAELNFKIVEFAAKSAIMSSYSFYGINFYTEALENLDRYLRKYPADKNIMYAHYLISIIHYEQISDEKKDLKPLLEADKKMTVLNKLEPELKGQVLIELGSLDDIPLEGIIEVGARLKEKSTYLPRTADFSRGGAKEIADMLSDMSSNDQERYMQTLQNEDPELYAAVKVLFLTFEDIMEKFPEDQVRTLLNSIELDTLPIAFKGLDEEKINELKDMLPQKKQAMYNEDLASKPQPKREVDNARKLFVDAVKQMEKDGAINLEDILSGGEMIE